jgi:hypothetical protein
MVKKTYGTRPLFIARRGVVSRNCLDMTVASFLGDACPLRRSEGDVFTEILRIFHGNGSLESTCFPKGIVLGNWTKTFHPRNAEVAEFSNIFMNVP